MRPLYALALCAAAYVQGFGAAQAGSMPGCDAFLQKLRADSGDLSLDYSRALVVSRARSDSSAFDITTRSDVDGTLTCRGDGFRRFEAHLVEPANGKSTAGLERLVTAALKASLGWDAAKSKGLLHSMSSDAREYLAASKQRGDVYIAGKTEEHAPGGVSLGMIYTEVDRAFVIVVDE